MDLRSTAPELLAFAADVGTEGPVVAVGGRTQWSVGGRPHPDAREVHAPAGIVAHEPAEMIVRCGAGTTVAELDAALATEGQMTPLDPALPGRATVGGVLAVGRSGPRRLRWGALRDLVLEIRYVSSEGRLVKGGAPVVKNVTGFDLCRLFVGSLGTLGLLAEVVLRVVPIPPSRRWIAGECDPFDLAARLHRPSSVLWDGTTTWVLLEGEAVDVDFQSELAGAAMREVDGPPPLPTGGRRSLRPGQLRSLPAGEWIAEVGVGVVHTAAPSGPRADLDPLHARVKHAFDPTGRLNPGRRLGPVR